MGHNLFLELTKWTRIILDLEQYYEHNDSLIGKHRPLKAQQFCIALVHFLERAVMFIDLSRTFFEKYYLFNYRVLKK